MLESKPRGKMLMLVAWVLLAAGIGLLWHRSGGKARVDAQRWAELEGKLETLAERVDQAAMQVDAIAEKFAALAGSVDTIARQFNELQTALQTALKSRPLPERVTPKDSPARRAQATRHVQILQDSFEQDIMGWMVPNFLPNIVGQVEHVSGADLAREGQGALKFSYEFTEAGQFAVASRLSGGIIHVSHLRFWNKSTDAVASLWISAGEADLSYYGTLVELKPAEGWRKFEIDLRDMELSEDSRDENGRLDLDQIASLSVVDIGSLFDRRGKNALLIDEFRAWHAAEQPEQPEQKDDPDRIF